jgi:hypothetical protein
MKTEFFFERRAYRGGYHVYGRVGDADIQTLTLKKEEHPDLAPGPHFMTLSEDDMQAMFNQMWALGFRPLDGTGNSGHIAALEYHLEDMRKLVFKEKK